MYFALSEQGIQIRPEVSGQRALCPSCPSEVVGRCGSLNDWHWSHLGSGDCDPWAEPSTQWHVDWQNYLRVRGAAIEVPMEKNGQRHRADAVLPSGKVIELQHSAISVDEINAREAFYGNMVWLFDIRHAYEQDRFLFRRHMGNYRTFRWKHAWKSVAFARAPAHLDLGGGKVFRLQKMFAGPPCGGGGYLKVVKALDDGKPLRDQRTDDEKIQADIAREYETYERAYQKYGAYLD